MKKIILLLFLLAFVACKSVKESPNVLVITSKEEVVMNDYTITINKIISDSRCPEGTNCIWAGELILELRVLKNDEIEETVVLTFSPKTEEENLAWFWKYMTSNKKLINYKISPTKTQKPLELTDYKIVLILE